MVADNVGPCAKPAKVRLVVSWEEDDGFTSCVSHTLPVLYESAEAFIVDFEAWCRANRGNPSQVQDGMLFAGHPFYPPHFFDGKVFVPPDVKTVDEWFQGQE